MSESTSAPRVRQRKPRWRRCHWPTDCRAPQDARFPNLPFCQQHVLLVWSVVDDHVGTTLAEKMGRMERNFSYKAELRRQQIRAMPRDERPGYIYFIKVGGQVKIGWASNILRRMRSYPPTSTLLAYHHGTMAEEKELHDRFAHCRIGGREWYEPRPDLEAHIAEVRKRVGPPDLQAMAPKRRPTGRQAVQLRSRSGGSGKR